jgi:hypothetical protein
MLITSNVIGERGARWHGSLIGANGTELTEKGHDMTRKDYILIADALNLSQRTVGTSGLYDAPTALGLASIILADSLARTNPRFDRERFLKACEASA